MRARDRSLLQELVTAGVLQADPGPEPDTVRDASIRLLRLLRRGAPSAAFYVFCRLNSLPLRQRAVRLINRLAVPIPADRLVSESLARFHAELERATGRAEDLYDRVPEMLCATLRSDVEALSAYVPGAGLELWDCRGLGLREWLDRSAGGTARDVFELSDEQYSALLAQSLLRLSLHDRRLLLTATDRGERGHLSSLSATAARRRLQEELQRALHWLRLREDFSNREASS